MRRCIIPAAFVVIAVLFSSCKDSTAPATGTLRVTTYTSGADFDPDGYVCEVDGRRGTALAANATVMLTGLEAGDHIVRLSHLSSNCSVAGQNPRTVTIAAGSTTHTTFEVTCLALTGALQITTVTTGDTLDWDGYELILDDSATGTIGINDTAVIEGLAARDHALAFGDVAVNCRGSQSTDSVTILAFDTTEVDFEVLCAPAIFDKITFAYINDQFVVNPDGSGVEILLPTLMQHARVSAQGTKLVFEHGCGRMISCIGVVNVDGSDLKLEFTGPTTQWPDWSPDGTRIAFESVRSHGSYTRDYVEIINADGTGRTTVTNGFTPRWSPDGRELAFGRPDRGGIWTITLDSGVATQLTSEADWSPTWSHDGRRIAFVRRQDGQLDIWVVNRDGTGLTNLTDTTDWNEAFPDWSPDGAKIVFSGIYVMDADGTNRWRLVDYGHYPNWSPMSALHR